MALLALVGLAGWFVVYPLDRWLAAALLATYVALVVFRPASCLLMLPILWPVVDLAPWSGHIYLNESDALVLATLLALGLRESVAPPPVTLTGRAPVRLNLGAVSVFGLLAVSVAVSGARGLSPLPVLDAADAAPLLQARTQAAPDLCLSCDGQPCLSACPVDAFTPQAYDVDRCAAHLHVSAGADCMGAGCLARRACPVGTEYRYRPSHAGFHMAAFAGRRGGSAPGESETGRGATP